MAKRKAVMEVCDNPDCRNEFESSKEYPAAGLHFKGGFWVSAGGGPIPSFYACSDECVVPAMNHVIAVASGGMIQ